MTLTLDPIPALWVALVAGIVGLGAAAGANRFGASVILGTAGAREADPIADRKLVDVVRELSIAANIPMPRVYVVPDGSKNAFATGRDPAHASIAVTRGLAEGMDREELQGVIGHELGHIRNLDTRYALYVAVLVGIVALVTDGFLRMVIEGWRHGAFYWKGDDKSAAATFVMGLGVGLFLLIVAFLLRLLAPLFSAARPGGVEPRARVPRRRDLGRVHAQPARARARADPARERQRHARGRQSRDAAPVVPQPGQGGQRPAEQPPRDASVHRRPDRPAAPSPGSRPARSGVCHDGLERDVAGRGRRPGEIAGCTRLARTCRNLRTMKGMSKRLADVAKKVGVSEATVSRVLNDKAGVSEPTRQAVLTALDVMGYERPTKLRGERARLVGLVLPELQNPIFPAFAEVVGGALAQQGFTPVLCTQTAGGVSEADYVDLLLQQQVSGVVFAGGLYAQEDAPHDHYAPPDRAQAADRPGQRGDRRAPLPARVLRRRGRGRAGDGPPAVARPHAHRAAPRPL